MRIFWLAALTLAALAARARADEVAGFVVDHDRVVPHAMVRVVGDRVVALAKTDAHGYFHVNGLPAGAYRVELEHGSVANHAPVRHVIDDRDWSRPLCFLRSRPFRGVLGARGGDPQPAQKPRPLIDTTSTALETDFVFFGH